MQEETIVAVFATDAHAEAALADLKAAGIPDRSLSRHLAIETVPGYSVPTDDRFDAPPSGFWSRLFGAKPEHPTELSDPGAGGAIITVDTAGASAAGIIAVLERYELVDLDERVTDIHP